ncbi:hypothetical protein HF524_00035 [Proteus mirabilis]|nr:MULTISPECIES: hypothetical protein [Proteus]MBA7797992.1 hypothetical protein [Citrobacter sp. RHBSTW-01065]ALE20777.1 hypothetical protein AOC00_00035 [Proteus mirabilis]ALE23903.1 hypothetical protein AOB99_00035 [Proteus mirabilis]AND14844.1 hypothetical protein AOUC001_18965 [Proteus mirabilis]EHZ6747836.1 hypothetical protein [Proteus mirabilis]
MDKNIFLSASIPLPDRDPKFIESADISAIRDSVNALSKLIIPKAHLIWGGHPSITPLIKFTLKQLGKNAQDHVTLYQSKLFEEFFPEDNASFANIKLVDSVNNDRKESLLAMRNEMLSKDKNFIAGIFIGGMEGVIEEMKLFQKYHPDTPIFPIATTGAAALEIYNMNPIVYPEEFKDELINNYAYLSLFIKLLGNKL